MAKQTKTGLPKLKEKLQHNFHTGHVMAHLTYLGAAALEGHGIYSIAAAALFVLTLVAPLLGQAEAEA